MSGLPSFLQEQYLVAAHRYRERGIEVAANVVPMICRIPGPVDVAAMDRALRAFVSRHDALRCRFELAGGRYVRTAVADLHPGCEQLTASPAGQEMVRGLVKRAIPETGWPLLRASVLAGDPSYVVLAVHHLVADAQSMVIAKAELETLYRAEVSGGVADLPAAASFCDHADAERSRFADDATSALHLASWYRVVGGRSFFPRAPIDVPADGETPGGPCVPVVALGPDALAALERACADQRATVFTAVVAAYGLAARRVTGGADVGVLVPVTNRDERTRTMVGWVGSMTPCYFRVGEGDGLTEHLAAARGGVARMLDCTGLPFTEAMRVLDPVSYHGDGEPFPTCGISFVDYTTGAADSGEWSVVESDPERSASYRMGFARTSRGLVMTNTAPPGAGYERLDREIVHVLRTWVRELPVTR